MTELFAAVFPEIQIPPPTHRELSSSRFLTRLRAGGAALVAAPPGSLDRALSHESDTVRGWAAFAVAEMNAWCPESLVHALLPFASDHHFAVREWAWLAARPTVVGCPDEFIAAVEPLAKSANANVRRFACESTRPRGVWSAHVPALVQDPELARSLVDSLAADESRYVQLSLGNWLNDAGKTNAKWVLSTLARWQAARLSVSPVVLSRATRNIS